MANSNQRYKIMERYMTYALAADLGLFFLYLLFSALGVIALKVMTTILILLISGGCLAFLFLTREMMKKRSLWMTTAAAAILVCLLFSLLLNYPRKNTYKHIAPNVSASEQNTTL